MNALPEPMSLVLAPGVICASLVVPLLMPRAVPANVAAAPLTSGYVTPAVTWGAQYVLPRQSSVPLVAPTIWVASVRVDGNAASIRGCTAAVVPPR